MRTTRKKLAAIAGGLAVLAFAGAAFAYFTNVGSGDGSATVGTSEEIELSGDVGDLLYPGGPDASVTVAIHNPGEGTQYVGTISGVVEDNGDCDGAWFEVDDIEYNASLDADGSDTADTAVRFVDNDDNQDACKDALMAITWSSN